jgi:hypothetical protein
MLTRSITSKARAYPWRHSRRQLDAVVRRERFVSCPNAHGTPHGQASGIRQHLFSRRAAWIYLTFLQKQCVLFPKK